MHNALSLSEDIVDRSQVFTRRKVENDLSTVHVVAGKVNSILKHDVLPVNICEMWSTN